MNKLIEVTPEQIDANNLMSKVVKQLRTAINKKDIKLIEAAEEKASRIDMTLVSNDLFSEYDDLFGQAYKLIMK